ncbi:uncharacterized protein At4g15970-like [Silene latifolia]|uniref:uncharacterized protein At4g15970-like n=1 Tax=Silene latifolia TaxID=37657 RepID=UPI003D780540
MKLDVKYNELNKVLKFAATKDRTVILTTLNEAWAAPNSVLDLFLESFRIGNNTTWLLNHLLVIALDDKAYARCQIASLVSHCYFLQTNRSSELAGPANFMTPNYLDLLWKRLAFLQNVLELGYNFIFTDADVMWFRDPFPYFTIDSDLQTSCDQFNGKESDLKNHPNNGFIFVRSNNRSIEFYKIWVSSRKLYPGLHEQDVFNKIKDGVIPKVGLKVRFISTEVFGGFCSPSRDFSKVCTMHANCCVGLDRKIQDLNTTLEDWKHYFYTNHTISHSSHWRVPKQCHM